MGLIWDQFTVLKFLNFHSFGVNGSRSTWRLENAILQSKPRKLHLPRSLTPSPLRALQHPASDHFSRIPLENPWSPTCKRLQNSGVNGRMLLVVKNLWNDWVCCYLAACPSYWAFCSVIGWPDSVPLFSLTTRAWLDPVDLRTVLWMAKIFKAIPLTWPQNHGPLNSLSWEVKRSWKSLSLELSLG